MAKAKFSSTQEALDAIFSEAIPLFAHHGFSGVSIRQVANAVGISIATLYHHFPDKKSLYLAAIEASFKNKAEALDLVLEQKGTLEEQLRLFVYRFTELMAGDENFRLLQQRELLEADPERLNVLANHVFFKQFQNVLSLAKRLAPNTDPHMTAISMFSLVFYHLEAAPIRRFLPGGRPEHDDPEFIASHVCHLLMNGVM